MNEIFFGKFSIGALIVSEQTYSFACGNVTTFFKKREMAFQIEEFYWQFILQRLLDESLSESYKYDAIRVLAAGYFRICRSLSHIIRKHAKIKKLNEVCN